MRRFKATTRARTFCRGHALIRNLARGFSQVTVGVAPRLRLATAWRARTAILSVQRSSQQRSPPIVGAPAIGTQHNPMKPFKEKNKEQEGEPVSCFSYVPHLLPNAGTSDAALPRLWIKNRLSAASTSPPPTKRSVGCAMAQAFAVGVAVAVAAGITVNVPSSVPANQPGLISTSHAPALGNVTSTT